MPRRRAETPVDLLRWYFNGAQADMGIRSNTGIMLERAAMGIVGAHSVSLESITESRMIAIEKHRQIGRALGALPRTKRAILENAFEERKFKFEVRKKFGDLSGIVLRLPLASRLMKDSLKRKRSSAVGVEDWLDLACSYGSKAERENLDILKAQAEEILKDAVSKFEREYNG